MDGLVDSLINISKTLPDTLMYLVLALSAFVENIFPPIPGDTIMAFGAFMVGVGRLEFHWVYISTTIGSLTGFMSLFELSRYFGKALLQREHIFFIKREHILNAEHWFHRYGYMVVLINRFLPGLRSAVSIAGGIFKLNRIYVLLFALISCAIWNIIWITLGYMLGNNWNMVKEGISSILERYNLAVTIFLLILVLYFFIKWLIRSKIRPQK